MSDPQSPAEATPAPHRYSLSFVLERHAEGLLAADVPPGRGACDAAVVLSLVYPENGTFRLALHTLDGRSGETLADKELFKAWLLLARRLARSETLEEGRRQYCHAVFETMFKILAGKRTGEGDDSDG